MGNCENWIEQDGGLQPFGGEIARRASEYKERVAQLTGGKGDLGEYANGYLYFGVHRQQQGWTVREWAPNAAQIALIGEFNGWDRTSHPMQPVGEGVWEIYLADSEALAHGQRIKLQITTAQGQVFDRIPSYCRRAVQHPNSSAFDGQVWQPAQPYRWQYEAPERPPGQPLFIYECHIGMAGEQPAVAQFDHFTQQVLPRIARLGYNAVQIMALMEHPYYASYGYQVSNFFAVCSRFGSPQALCRLVDTAHSLGMLVIMDIVHSHAASNTLEGLACFDGTDYQYFHGGKTHPQWGTMLFDYGKEQVRHFLLSNLKFWLEEYRLDGFRFDGVTSMLYRDHGLGEDFGQYRRYFDHRVDRDALQYLQLATTLCRQVRPGCVLLAEDVSGMPGLCAPPSQGGLGFDYRLGMGVPDYWIRTLAGGIPDRWHVGEMWWELTRRRPEEKVIGYCECHDQALVGEKTILSRLADEALYWQMDRNSNSPVIRQAVALHKMIRLVTCGCAGDGYLNFMGNEFGHPQWIDFPREGNGWSYEFATRRWSLADNAALRYQQLQLFDGAMVALLAHSQCLEQLPSLLWQDVRQGSLVFRRGRLVFVFHFHRHEAGRYALNLDGWGGCELVLDSEDTAFGGQRWAPLPTHWRGEQGAVTIPLQPQTAAVYRLLPHQEQ